MRGRRAGDARSRGGDSEVKQSKPAMEKRRRARINASLAELRSLIPNTIARDNRKYTKLEKADILEMAVEYLRHLQELNKEKPPAAGGTSYSLGYSECTQEVNQFLSSSNPLAARIKGSLLDHLNGCAPHSTPDSPSSSPSLTAPGSTTSVHEPNFENPLETKPKTTAASQFTPSSIIARCLLSSTSLSGHLSSLTQSHRRATSPVTIVSSTSDDVTACSARGSGRDHDDVVGDQINESSNIDEDNQSCLIPEQANGMTSNDMTTGGMTSNGMTSDGMTSDGMTSDGTTSNGMTSMGMTSNDMTSDDVHYETRDDYTYMTSGCFNTDVQMNDTAVGKNNTKIYHDTSSVNVIQGQGQPVFNNSVISKLSSEHISQSDLLDDLLDLTAGHNLDGKKTLNEINGQNSGSQKSQHDNDNHKNSTITQFPVRDILVESKRVKDRNSGYFENLHKPEGIGNEQSDVSLRCNENTMFIADSNGKKDGCNITEKSPNCESTAFSELFKSTVQHTDVEEKRNVPLSKFHASSEPKICAPLAGNSVSSCLVPIYVQTSFGTDELQSYTRAFVMKSSAVDPPALTIDTGSTPQPPSVTIMNTNVNNDPRASMISAAFDAASSSSVRPETESPENAREDGVSQSMNAHILNKVIYLGTSIVPETGTATSHEMYPPRTAVEDGHPLNTDQVSKASPSPRVLVFRQIDQEMHAPLNAPEISEQKRKYPFLSTISNNRVQVTKECRGVDIFPEHDLPLNRLPKLVSRLELSKHGDEFYDNVKQPKLTSHVGDLNRPRLAIHPSYPVRDLSHHCHSTCRQRLAEQPAIGSGLKKDLNFHAGLLCNEHLSDFGTSIEHLSDFGTSNELLCRDKMSGPLEGTLCCAGSDSNEHKHGTRYKRETVLCRRDTGGLPKTNHSACHDEHLKGAQYVDVITMPAMRCHGHRQPGGSHANDQGFIHGETSRNPCLPKPPRALGTCTDTDGTSSYKVTSLVRQNSSEPLNLSKSDKNILHSRACTCGSLENQTDRREYNTERGLFPLLTCDCNGCHGKEQISFKPDLRDILSTNCGGHCKGLATTSCDRNHQYPDSQSRMVRPVYEHCTILTDKIVSGNVRNDMPINLSVTSSPKRLLDDDEIRAGEEGRNTTTNNNHFNGHRHPTRSRFLRASVPDDVTSPEWVTTAENVTRAVRSASLSSLSVPSLPTSAQRFQDQSDELDDDVWRPW